jgi:hypothetical protein
MKRKTILSAVLIAGVLTSICVGQIEISHMTGVGTRAYGLANNYVALSNDQSGLFWNPAGLAFVPSREFQISFDALSQKTNTDFFDQSQTSVVQRLRLVNVGYLHAFPSSQGGLTIAGALQNPYTFDDVRSFSGYQTAGNNSVYESRNAKYYGGLNYWTGGFGLQVAEGLGIGVSAAFVAGSSTGENIFYRDSNGVVVDNLNDDYDRNITRSYLGYDFRLGLLYNFRKHFDFGLRFVFPQTLWFTEDIAEINPHTSPTAVYDWPTANGKIFSSYSGAMGFSGTFPFMTFSTEFRARAPYSLAYPAESIPDSSLAGKTIIGAGIGLEVPLFVSTTLLRAGYSWDQFDTHLFAREYDDPQNNDPPGKPNWDPLGEKPVGDQHLITVGTAFIMKSVCLEISYGYTIWKLETKSNLTESHTQHRLLTSLSFRF